MRKFGSLLLLVVSTLFSRCPAEPWAELTDNLAKKEKLDFGFGGGSAAEKGGHHGNPGGLPPDGNNFTPDPGFLE